MLFFVYLLECADGSYYVGHADNLELRLIEHEKGVFAGYTALRLPVKMVWSESFATRDAALKVEEQLKGWRREKKAALISGGWTAVAALGKKLAGK